MISEKMINQRIDKIVVEQLKEKGFDVPSRTFVQEKWGNWILVNQREVKPSYKIRNGDDLYINEECIGRLLENDKKSEEIVAQQGELEVVYEDEDFLIINKAKGVVVHPGVGNEGDTLANYVRYYLEQKGEFDIHLERCGVVHRLDKGVSGLIVFAKNMSAQKWLKEQFESHKVRKLYIAKVEVKQINKEFDQMFEEDLDIKETVQTFIDNDYEIDDTWYKAEGFVGRDHKDRVKMVFKKYEYGGSRRALSYIKRINANTVLIKIETGRMHQIRVTLKDLGMNIIGDTLYGEGRGMPDKIELESILLSFKDLNGKYITVNLLNV